MIKILVVDDEPIPCKVLRKVLASRGYEVRTAATVQEAIQVGSDFRPDVLLTDWLLKDEHTGLHVAEALRDFDPAVRVVFLSGLPADTLEPRIRHLKNYQLIEKPCQFELLIGAVLGDS